MRLLRGEGETRYVGFKQKGFSSATLCVSGARSCRRFWFLVLLEASCLKRLLIILYPLTLAL